MIDDLTPPKSSAGNLAHGLGGIRRGLAGFFAMKGKLALKVTKVLEASDLALVATAWSFAGTGPGGKPVEIAAKSADVLRRHAAKVNKGEMK